MEKSPKKVALGEKLGLSSSWRNRLADEQFTRKRPASGKV
jgi:hypothetical protein